MWIPQRLKENCGCVVESGRRSGAYTTHSQLLLAASIFRYWHHILSSSPDFNSVPSATLSLWPNKHGSRIPNIPCRNTLILLDHHPHGSKSKPEKRPPCHLWAVNLTLNPVFYSGLYHKCLRVLFDKNLIAYVSSFKIVSICLNLWYKPTFFVVCAACRTEASNMALLRHITLR
jgi:hypothetical protein